MASKQNLACYGRFKGLPWFDSMSTSRIMVFGQGGIGSWLTLFLARTGASILTFDFDKFEEHNLAGQLCGKQQVGMLKVDAVAKVVKDLCGEDNVTPINMYIEDNPDHEWVSYLSLSDVVCTSFDNIATRRIVFKHWREHGKADSLFVDGRMSVQNGEVFTCRKGDAKEENFYFDSMFDDALIEPAPCTQKATSHCGALTGALMTSQITNWFTVTKTTEPSILVNHLEFHLPITYFNDKTVQR